MQLSVISLFPEMFSAFKDQGVIRRAFDRHQVKLDVINPRSYTQDAHQTVDDRPFGGGPGMVMCYEPLAKAIESAKMTLGSQAKVVYLSPQGKPLVQSDVVSFAQQQTPLILLCGRYEGIDQRVIETYVDVEISVGDYVLTGGELPAMVMMDAIIRLLPGVLNHADSAAQESFSDQMLLDCPHYTRPAQLPNGQKVPDVLRSGDHKKIAAWRQAQRAKKTYQRRSSLLTCQCQRY